MCSRSPAPCPPGARQQAEMHMMDQLEREMDAMGREPAAVLENGAESPFLMQEMRLRERQAEALLDRVKTIVKIGRRFLEHGKRYAEASRLFAGTLLRPWSSVESPQERLRTLSLERVGKELGSVVQHGQECQEMLLVSIESTVLEPLEQLAKDAGAELALEQMQCSKARNVYLTTLAKALGPRKAYTASVHDAYAASEAAYDERRASLIALLNSILVDRKLAIIEIVCTTFYSFLTYFHAGHELAASLEPFTVSIRELSAHRRHAAADTALGGAEASAAKEGYLFKQSSNLVKDWKRRWFVLESGRLAYFRGSNLMPEFVANMVIATVRLAEPKGRPFCFEIVSPNSRSYTLQASSLQERDEWIAALQQSTQRSLEASPSPAPAHTNAIRAIRTANPTCADCDAPNPDWTSINLGVMLCLACSGVHRSLGVRVSKVRSLSLDSLDVHTLRLLQKLGNRTVNAIWEAGGTQDRPTVSSTAEHRETFISAKYRLRSFVDLDQLRDQLGSQSVEQFVQMSITENRLQRLLCASALGCDLASLRFGCDSALHLALASNADLSILAYLKLQGVSLTDQGSQEASPLALAAAQGGDVADLLQGP